MDIINNDMLTIDQVIKILQDYKAKYGNLEVGQIFYADVQY